MADLRSQEENAKLKEQIKFMTDLINNAKKQEHRHQEKPIPLPSRLSGASQPTYARRGKGSEMARKNSTAYQTQSLHFPKHKQIDKAKYSFVRTSSAPIATTSSASRKTQNVDNATEVIKIHSTPPRSRSTVTNSLDKTSGSGLKTRDVVTSNSQKTPVHAAESKIDLDKHSLASLKKMLATKMEAKALRNAYKSAKLSSSSIINTPNQQIVNISKSETEEGKLDSKKKISQQHSHLGKHQPHSTPFITDQPVDKLKSKKPSLSKANRSTSDTQSSRSSSKTLQVSKKSPRTSSGYSQIFTESSGTLTGLSHTCTSSDLGLPLASKEPPKAAQSVETLPSKVELAEGLKTTEAKIKELTAELTKLKEVAKIVSSSPQKVAPKPAKVITSASGHHLRTSSLRTYHQKCVNRKHFQSNTQHVAHYVVSKYKLNKVSAKFPSQSKLRSNGRTRFLKKKPNLNIFHAKMPKNAYRWTKQAQNKASDAQKSSSSTRWSVKTYRKSLGSQHSKKNLIEWMPFWKRKLLMRGTSYKQQNSWHSVKDNRWRLCRRGRNPLATTSRAMSASQKGYNDARTITVRGVKFQIGTRGKTLQRIGDKGSLSCGSNPRKSISRVDYRGVTYKETKPGTLEKSSSHQTRIRANQALYKSIAVSTGKHRLKKSNRQFCMFYCRFGKCNRGENCAYIHDPDKVAVCTRFLRGTCRQVNCPFSHKVAKEKMPVCSYFLKGGCVRENCPYRHVNVSKDAKVCEDFLRGFCPRGEKCKEKHILECPEFSRTGQCSEGKKCKLDHRKKPLKRKTSNSMRSGGQKKRNVENPRPSPPEGPSTSQSDNSIVIQAKETVPFKMMKLPAFISIVSSDTEPSSPQDTEKPPIKKPQEQLRIKPRI